MESKISGLVGLALRQGTVSLGLSKAVELIRSNKASIAFIDSSASKNAEKRMINSCNYYNVPLYIVSENMLEKATGKADLKVLALPKGNLSDEIKKHTGGLKTFSPVTNTGVRNDG